MCDCSDGACDVLDAKMCGLSGCCAGWAVVLAGDVGKADTSVLMEERNTKMVDDAKKCNATDKAMASMRASAAITHSGYAMLELPVAPGRRVRWIWSAKDSKWQGSRDSRLSDSEFRDALRECAKSGLGRLISG
jgi:hypothetical protein